MIKEYTEIVDLENFGLSFEEKKMWSWKDARSELAWCGRTLFPSVVPVIDCFRVERAYILQATASDNAPARNGVWPRQTRSGLELGTSGLYDQLA